MSYMHTCDLTGAPFPHFPDPDRWFSSRTTRRAVQDVRDSFLDGRTNALALIGPKGVGKSTMCAWLCRDIAQNAAVVCVVVPSQYQDGHIENLIFAACTGQVKQTGVVSRKALCRQLLDRRNGTASCVVFIDDAHHLPPGALIAVYSLLTLQKENRSVVRIVMAGDESLQQRLSLPPFSTPEQRTVTCIPLEPLTGGETIAYVEHRLQKAGWKRGVDAFPFSPEVLGLLVVDGGGLPGKINTLCDQGLSSAFLRNRMRVQPEDLSYVSLGCLRSTWNIPSLLSAGLNRLCIAIMWACLFFVRRRRAP